MRKFLAIVLCRLLRFVGGLLGKGSSLPGEYALKLCPDVLSRIRLPETVIAVTGSNGKTSTVEMLAAVLRAAGKTVAYNAQGSNQIEGVTTMILCACTLGGKMKQDVLLIESDERYARYTFRWFRPTHYVITNLYRDQLTRNGHPQWVFDAIADSLHEETVLVLNADDPLVSLFGRERRNVRWFGMEPVESDTQTLVGRYHDAAYCPVCGKPLHYSAYHYNHIGIYDCPACGYGRHMPDERVTKADLDAGLLEINGTQHIRLALRSLFNVYNLLAVYTVCRLLGIPGERICTVLSDYILKNGRFVRFRCGRHEGEFLVSKHENSVSYDLSLRYAVAQKKPCTVVVIVDAVSRKYFTSETSWLWDINFELLNSENVRRILLCGKYCNDLALRFDFTGIAPERIQTYAQVADGVAALRESGDETVYTVTCFSDEEKFLSNVEVLS